MTWPNPMELFFVFWTFLGTLIAIVNLWHAVIDRRYVIKHKINAGREFVLLDDIRREAMGVLAQAFLVVLAVAILIMPDRPRSERTLFQWVIVGALLLLPTVIAMNSILDAWARRKLQKMYTRRRKTDEKSNLK